MKVNAMSPKNVSGEEKEKTERQGASRGLLRLRGGWGDREPFYEK